MGAPSETLTTESLLSDALTMGAPAVAVAVVTLVGLWLTLVAAARVAVWWRSHRLRVRAFPEEVPIVVIAAAVAAALDHAPHRIVQVNPSPRVRWAFDGRRQIFSSHQLPRRHR